MTWLRKMRPVLVALGLALGLATLIGARSLTGGSGPDAKATAPPAVRGGPVVLGLVDTDPPPVFYGLPPVLASGTVVEVHVKDGDEVKAGQPLYRFDDTIQKADVEQAKAAINSANTKVKEAEEGVKQHTGNIEFAKIAADAADGKARITEATHAYVNGELEKAYKMDEKLYPRSIWPELKKSSLDWVKTAGDYTVALNEWKVAKEKVAQVQRIDPQVKVKEAEAAVKQAEKQQAKAQSVVDLCVVKAQMDGTVEQITIGAGTTMGVGTRGQALWLIPNGPRVVRAEVETEFAHRVGPELVGKTVVISDHSDPKLTYSGTVRRIPPVFLLKRATSENFLGGDTRVIEAVIEVSDPSPTGKPPLRVGQRVRVNLGQ